jgi:hypothetical protein
MSFQMAMMGGMAAMTLAQTAQAASKSGAAAGRQIAGLHEAEYQNAIASNIAKSETAVQKMGYEVTAGGYLTQAAQTDVTAAEIGIRTKQQELGRRRQLAHLEQTNAIDLVARGGVATGQDSAGAIDEYNRAMAEGEGLRSIFADLRATGRDAASAAKQRQLEMSVADAGAQAQEGTMDALLAGGGKLFSLGLSYDSGKGGGKGKTPAEDMPGN